MRKFTAVFLVIVFILTMFSFAGCETVTAYSRIDESGMADPEGNFILFGEYPQTEVTDKTLISELTKAAGTLPTENDKQKWTSYGYYKNGEIGNFMWYIDKDMDGTMYRGVYFIGFRPYSTYYDSVSDESLQDQNGYDISTVYWFKYEPIKWKILNESDGITLILCEMSIDSQAFENIACRNSYESSSIRTWLNNQFYDTAFNSLQQKLILTTTVDNSSLYAGYENNPYACADTLDKIFLASFAEFMYSDYSFNNYDFGCKQNTDYAKIQGALNYYNNGYWWLRVPSDNCSDDACCINSGGYFDFNNVHTTCLGIVPALTIRLS